MAEQIAQAIHDGETKSEAAMGTASSKPVEFAEDVALLVLRNPRPAVPHLDIQRVAAPPAANHDGARSGVSHRIGNEIEHDPLQQDWIAARPRAAVDELERQSFFAGRVSEGAVDAFKQLSDGEFDDIGGKHAGVELGNVEQR